MLAVSFGLYNVNAESCGSFLGDAAGGALLAQAPSPVESGAALLLGRAVTHTREAGTGLHKGVGPYSPTGLSDSAFDAMRHRQALLAQASSPVSTAGRRAVTHT